MNTEIAMLTKAAPAIARAVPANLAWSRACGEKELPVKRPARSTYSYHGHTKIRAYASGIVFSSKRYSVVKSPSSNITLERDAFYAPPCGLHSKTAPQGGR